ncbi:hypothetical protein KIPB_016996, partial [Kipferlia bialata]
ITLAEALCGFVMKLKHLDGRMLTIVRQAGEVVEPKSVLCVPGEGMPIKGRPFDHGRLFIQFNIKFPTAKQ